MRAGRPDPDPVTGSAGISGPQSTFAGSFRQGRGRLVDRLRAGPIPHAEVATAAGWPGAPERAVEALASLVRDGMVVVADDGTVSLS
jgi:hypothetical protein